MTDRYCHKIYLIIISKKKNNLHLKNANHNKTITTLKALYIFKNQKLCLLKQPQLRKHHKYRYNFVIYT